MEASSGFGSFPLGWRANELEKGIAAEFSVHLRFGGLSGTGRLDALPSFFGLLAILAVVSVTLAVDLVLDHLRFGADDHGSHHQGCCREADVCGQGPGSADYPFVNASLA